MFRDYSVLDTQQVKEANCKVYRSLKNDEIIIMRLPNGGHLLLSTFGNCFRKTEAPRYSPKSKVCFHEPDWEEITLTEAINQLYQQLNKTPTPN